MKGNAPGTRTSYTFRFVSSSEVILHLNELRSHQTGTGSLPIFFSFDHSHLVAARDDSRQLFYGYDTRRYLQYTLSQVLYLQRNLRPDNSGEIFFSDVIGVWRFLPYGSPHHISSGVHTFPPETRCNSRCESTSHTACGQITFFVFALQRFCGMSQSGIEFEVPESLILSFLCLPEMK